LPFELFFPFLHFVVVSSSSSSSAAAAAAFWCFALTTEFAIADPPPAKAPKAVAMPVNICKNPPVFIYS